MSIQRPSCFFNLWSSCSSRPKQRWLCRLLLPLVVGYAAAEASPPPTTPTAGQAIPPLIHTPCYSAATVASHHSRTSEPSYSSPRGLPLPRLPRLRVVPFLGLAVVHCLVLLVQHGQRGQGMASIGHGLYVERLTAGSTAVARKCLLITRKIIIPPRYSGDPPGGHRISLKMSPPDCWDPPATSSHARKCVRAKK